MSRTEVMLARWAFYVYRIYGLHWMHNVVTGAENEGSRSDPRCRRAKWTWTRCGSTWDKCLVLRKASAAGDRSLFRKRNNADAQAVIVATHRIGVAYAGPIWAPRSCALCWLVGAVELFR